MQKSNYKHYVHLHFLVFIAGFTAILGELIINSSEAIVWHRMIIASLLTAIFMIISKKSFKINLNLFLKYSLLGLIIALHWITFFEAIEKSNISLTLAMFSTAAFFTSLLEPIFFKRKIIKYELFLGILVIIGVLIIFNAEFKYVTGIFLGILSALLASLFSVLNGVLIKKDNAYKISLYEFISGVIFISLYLYFTSDLSLLLVDDFFSLNYLYIFILGSVCTAYAFIASVYLLKFITPYSLVLSYNLEPVYGVLLALFFFGNDEKMSFPFYLGFLLILISVFLNMYIKNNTNNI
tara:strand:+ start:975 stop:1859 length:885 start_codon:yes stop_codon:yes gene_type:complete